MDFLPPTGPSLVFMDRKFCMSAVSPPSAVRGTGKTADSTRLLQCQIRVVQPTSTSFEWLKYELA